MQSCTMIDYTYKNKIIYGLTSITLFISANQSVMSMMGRTPNLTYCHLCPNSSSTSAVDVSFTESAYSWAFHKRHRLTQIRSSTTPNPAQVIAGHACAQVLNHSSLNLKKDLAGSTAEAVGACSQLVGGFCKYCFCQTRPSIPCYSHKQIAIYRYRQEPVYFRELVSEVLVRVVGGHI